MGKAAGAAVVAFLLGGGMVTVFGGWLGVNAEAAALALVGFGLIGSSVFMAAPKVPAESRKLLPKATQAQQQGA